MTATRRTRGLPASRPPPGDTGDSFGDQQPHFGAVCGEHRKRDAAIHGRPAFCCPRNDSAPAVRRGAQRAQSDQGGKTGRSVRIRALVGRRRPRQAGRELRHPVPWLTPSCDPVAAGAPLAAGQPLPDLFDRRRAGRPRRVRGALGPVVAEPCRPVEPGAAAVTAAVFCHVTPPGRCSFPHVVQLLRRPF